MVYYFIFAIYEPLLTVLGFLGALADPKKVSAILLCATAGR